jgi:hypothetical protein
MYDETRGSDTVRRSDVTNSARRYDARPGSSYRPAMVRSPTGNAHL